MTHLTASGVIIGFSLCFSFKIMRIMTAKLFGKPYFSANFLKKSHFYRPFLCQLYISLFFVSFPLLFLSFYILATFSTGNIVFIMALDCGIVTFEDILVSFGSIWGINGEMREEKAKFELPKYSTETQETAVLDLEQIQVQMVGESGEGQRGDRVGSDGKKYFDSERDIYELTEATSQAAELPLSVRPSPLDSCSSQDFVNVSFSPQDFNPPPPPVFMLNSDGKTDRKQRGNSEKIAGKQSEEEVEDC